MSDWAQERAIRGAAAAPLSADQVRSLVLLARRTFDALIERGEISKDADFDDWRHRECLMAVERPGLRACGNEDFMPLKAHFLRSLGAREAADRAQWVAATEPRRWAGLKLRRECEAARHVIGDPDAYIAAICRSKFKCAPAECSEKQLWTLVFDIRRAAQHRRRPAGGGRRL